MHNVDYRLLFSDKHSRKADAYTLVTITVAEASSLPPLAIDSSRFGKGDMNATEVVTSWIQEKKHDIISFYVFFFSNVCIIYFNFWMSYCIGQRVQARKHISTLDNFIVKVYKTADVCLTCWQLDGVNGHVGMKETLEDFTVHVLNCRLSRLDPDNNAILRTYRVISGVVSSVRSG